MYCIVQYEQSFMNTILEPASRGDWNILQISQSHQTKSWMTVIELGLIKLVKLVDCIG